MQILIDDLSDPRIARFLDHIAEMRRVSPPESKHALDLDALRQPDITFWTVWEGTDLVGCGAIKELDDHHGEIKSMRIDPRHKRTGIASRLLQYIITTARCRGYRQLSLETGSMDHFHPARELYRKHGFEYCQPFGNYTEDQNSVHMTLYF